MHIAIRHNLQVFDPADPSLSEDAAILLPIRGAEAVMGETVAAYLDRVAWRFDLPTICRINGECYGRAEWADRALAVNDNVEFVSRPLGSGSGGSTIKTIASVVALVALTAVAGPAGTAAAGSVLFGAGAATGALASLFSAAIVGAGALAISYFLSPKAGGKSAATEALYSFGFQGNQARPMQPIPVLNGRIRFAPDYAAPTYSEYDGDAMIDYALFALTCGRMRMEQVLIGDTPIWDYQTGPNPDFPGIGLQFVEPGDQVALYPVNVVTAEELSGSELSTTFTPGYIVNAAGTQAKELLLDFVWPGGAYHTSKDKILKADTHILVRVRTVDDAGAPTGPWQEVFGKIYSNKKQSQIRITERLTVAPGRYEVSARRVNEPTASDNGTDAVTWTALRAHIEGPQSFPRVSVLAVKGTASKQLSGISGGQLRVIGTRILPVWRDGLFVEEPTRSIAWAALDWWRNGDYAAGLSLSDTDFQAFVAYDALWATLGHTFDHRFTEVQNLDDVLETVLKAGRAFPAPVGDKLTITRDQPRGLSRMLFTENDIVRDSLEIDYALSDEAWADGMVGEYVDQTTWRLAEVSSAPDGVQLLRPARVQLEGIVDRKQATGAIRFMAAESQYRRITVSWIARMEGRLLKRGDLVKITAEEPETWGESCEIVSASSDGLTLTLDPAPAWEASGNHYVEIRQRDGRPWGPARVTRGASDAFAVVNGSDASTVAERQGMTLADAVGRSGTQERAWLAFSPGQPRTFPVLITEGDPDQDGEHIHLTGVIDAQEVYATTEEGVPPLLQIPDLFSSALPAILGLNARASQRQLAIVLTAGWQPAKNAASYIADVSSDGGQEWVRAYEGDRTTFEAIIGGSDQTCVRVAGVTPSGTRGAFYVVEVSVPDLVVSNQFAGLIQIDYPDLAQVIRDNLARIDTIQAQTQAAIDEANAAVDAALARLDSVRKSLSSDPAVRQRYIDPLVSGLRDDVDILTRAITRNVQDLSLLRDNLTNAGMEVIPGEGRVRIYAIEALRDSVGETITNLAITLDALKGEIELYAANQKSDIEGVIQSITTVTTTLNALEGTITDNVTAALFDPLEARISSAETVLDAQAASIASKASQATVDAQGVRLTTAEQNISAATGEISQTITTATAGLALDLSLLPRTLAGFTDFINAQSASLNQQFAYATTNMQANFDAAGRATATLRTELLVYQDGASAQFLQITKAIADTNSALVTQTTLLQAGIATAQGQVVSESQARASADTALGQRVDSVSATVGSNTSAINTLQTAYVTADENLARQINAVTSQTDSDRAYFLSEQQTRITNDTTIATNLTNLTVQTDNDRAYFLSEQQARINQDVAFVSDINNLYATTGNNSASITATNKTVTDIYTAQASTNIDLYARSDRGTAFGRFGMTAVSAPSGVSVRLAAQVSTDSGGAQRNAGYYLDLLPDGTSRFLIDANFFAITANGGVTYPLQFDGTTLTIPALRVGTLTLEGNSVSDKQIKSGVTVDLSGPQNGGWVEIAGTAFEFDVDTNPGWGVVITGSANMQATATGTNSVYRSVSVEAAIALNGNPYNAAAFSVVSIGAGGGVANSNTKSTGIIGSTIMEVFTPGRNRISIMYRFKADAGCSARVDFSQIKAIVIKR